MRLHLIGFPHTRIDESFPTCAYTQKTGKFAKMGWDGLTVYATEGSDVAGAELVPVLTEKQRKATFGRNDPKKPPEWPTDEQWAEFNARAALEVAVRAQPGDLLLLAGGWSQRAVAETNPHLTCCEPGVGYEGIYANFVAFESYAWQHYLYGKKNMGGLGDGRWFDRVIPNYFDLDEFPVVKAEGTVGDYLLFVGRVVSRKGVTAAADIAHAAGMPLKVAGPGPLKWRKGRFISAPEVTIKGDVEYLGVLGPQERNEVMAGAYALLAPTVYVEPFGGVAVEAMLSGTPAVTTDWGAFAETVQPGVSGFRVRNVHEAVKAIEACAKLRPKTIRNYAAKRYSLAAVRPQFVDWFAALESLQRDGWYEVRG